VGVRLDGAAREELAGSPVGGGVWWAVAWWTGPGVIPHRQKETIMSDLIAIGYPGEATAEAAAELQDALHGGSASPST
jgi:hypothetical protein